MTLGNLSHALTPADIVAVEQLTGQPARAGMVERGVDLKIRFDNQASFVEQAPVLVESVGPSAEQWQTMPLLINLRSFGVTAAVVLAEVEDEPSVFAQGQAHRPVPTKVSRHLAHRSRA